MHSMPVVSPSSPGKTKPRTAAPAGALAACAVADTFNSAWENAYSLLKCIKFDGMFYRKDIGLPGAAESGKL